MINKEFYKSNNVIAKFLGGFLQHYPIREKATILSTWSYTVQYGDTMYTLAKKIFGPDEEYLWTYIADVNFARQPDDLQPGEVIKLPILILSEIRYNVENYGKTTSTTTKI